MIPVIIDWIGEDSYQVLGYNRLHHVSGLETIAAKTMRIEYKSVIDKTEPVDREKIMEGITMDGLEALYAKARDYAIEKGCEYFAVSSESTPKVIPFNMMQSKWIIEAQIGVHKKKA